LFSTLDFVEEALDGPVTRRAARQLPDPEVPRGELVACGGANNPNRLTFGHTVLRANRWPSGLREKMGSTHPDNNPAMRRRVNMRLSDQKVLERVCKGFLAIFIAAPALVAGLNVAVGVVETTRRLGAGEPNPLVLVSKQPLRRALRCKTS
jgi:hypothetical protein